MLLRHLLDRIDQQAGVADPAARRRGEKDPATVLAIEVSITRQVAERSGDIIQILASAAGVEPEMAEAYAAGMERHRAGARATVQRLAALKAIPRGRFVDEATAVVATMTSVPVYATLTRDFGWSFDQCADWITRTLTSQLLAPAAR